MADEIKMSVRSSPGVVAALKRLAEADDRSLQAYVGRVLADHVRKKTATLEEMAK